MSVSGYDEKYFFYGFLPKREKEIESKIKLTPLHDFIKELEKSD